MVEGLRILAIVPARGGSKGVPMKNIKPVNGLPLLAYTAKLISEIAEIDRAVVSTDSRAIADIAERYGLAAPFLRPEGISGDLIGDYDVLRHGLDTMEALDRVRYDVVLMLQPTCPLRQARHIRSAIAMLVENRLDSVWSVTRTDLKYHPLKQLVIEDGLMRLFDKKGETIVARQQLVPTYTRNGAVYAIARDCLMTQKKTLGDRSGAVVIEDTLVNVDTIEDFDKLERILAGERGQ